MSTVDTSTSKPHQNRDIGCRAALPRSLLSQTSYLCVCFFQLQKKYLRMDEIEKPRSRLRNASTGVVVNRRAAEKTRFRTTELLSSFTAP